MYGSATIHDHFDGSANCVQCGGKCQLTGADLFATALIRFAFEGAAMTGNGLPYVMVSQMESAGVDVRLFFERAKETNKR